MVKKTGGGGLSQVSLRGGKEEKKNIHALEFDFVWKKAWQTQLIIRDQSSPKS